MSTESPYREIVTSFADWLLNELKRQDSISRAIEHFGVSTGLDGKPLREPDPDHTLPDKFVRRHADDCGVDLALYDRIDPGDCGYVIPIHVLGEWAAVVFHPGEGWRSYVGSEIPDWIMQQFKEAQDVQ